LRSGSEDLASIVGMAAAADILGAEMEGEVARLQAIRDRLVERVLTEIPDSHLNGHPNERLPNNAHLRFDGIEGEAMVLSLRDQLIAAALVRPAAQRRSSRHTPCLPAGCCTRSSRLA